jgi:hypothetical protein
VELIWVEDSEGTPMAKETVLHEKPGMPPSAGDGARQLELAVAHAKQLVAQHFGDVVNLQSAPAQDAETDDPYVEVSFEVREEVSDVREAYDAFTTDWVKAYPIEIREQMRFGFAII